MFEAVQKSVRWGWVKMEWTAGNYARAITVLNNSMPNLTYPGGPEEMDRLRKQYGHWGFTGPMAGVTWWREVWHFMGGLGITLPFFYWPTLCFGVSIIIAIWKAAAEFYGDAQGSPDIKNVIDWLFWIFGTATVTVCSFVLFGPREY